MSGGGSLILIWVLIVVIIGIASSVKRKKDMQARQARAQQAAKEAEAARNASRPNPIVEKAKKNTQDVHRSHVQREKESREREYGGGPRQPVQTMQAQERRPAGNSFGSPQSGTAASGVPVSGDEYFREKREQLITELRQERAEAAGKRKDNRIVDAAKENALVTSLDNLMDSRKDFIREVQEVMVKGPDVSIPNERDFVAEGMEMVNDAMMSLY